MERVLRGSAVHDARPSITGAARVIMIHAQVVAHLMGHHCGVIRQGVVTELLKQKQPTQSKHSPQFIFKYNSLN